ncbi:MAG: nucleotide exchange factor GrpE [Eggerthellaceae bacterium]|nr:nucleotide exchange factor GrpE [Eggerthellaceae bacterium]
MAQPNKDEAMPAPGRTGPGFGGHPSAAPGKAAAEKDPRTAGGPTGSPAGGDPSKEGLGPKGGAPGTVMAAATPPAAPGSEAPEPAAPGSATPGPVPDGNAASATPAAPDSAAPAPAAPGSEATSNKESAMPGSDPSAVAPPAAPAAPGGTASEPQEASTPEALVEKAQAEAQEWKDKHMRLHAEWDTYRRRTAEQRADEKATATEKLVEHLLPVIDDFEKAIEYAEEKGEAGLLGGVQAIRAKLVAALEKEGVEVLDPKGEAFHALECQAVATLEDKSQPDETVAAVFQKGYRMGKKVLRPAMVTVTTGGPKREAPKDPDGE